jgi:hypothetical protein
VNRNERGNHVSFETRLAKVERELATNQTNDMDPERLRHLTPEQMTDDELRFVILGGLDSVDVQERDLERVRAMTDAELLRFVQERGGEVPEVADEH